MLVRDLTEKTEISRNWTF